jgi:hypothetical protein
MDKMGWKRNDVFEVMKDTIDASFAPEVEKNMIRKEIRNNLGAQDVDQNPQFNDTVHYYD